MVKALIASIITAAVFFTLGGITVLIFRGSDSEPVHTDHGQVNVPFSGDSVVTLIDEKVLGSKEFKLSKVQYITQLFVDSSDVKTYIALSNDNNVTVSVDSGTSANAVKVKAEMDPFESRFDITVDKDCFLGIDIGDSTVTLSLPDTIYDNLNLTLGSGTLQAKDIRARQNEFDIGSGTFELSQKENFSAELMKIDIGSGSVKIANADSEIYNVDMGSGSFNISGLTGSGDINMGSGKGIVEFAKLGSLQNNITLGSGSLSVYVPSDAKSDLYTDIGSGKVKVECCDVSQSLKNNGHVAFNGGHDMQQYAQYNDEDDEDIDYDAYRDGLDEIYVDLGSGKVTFYDTSEFKPPQMFEDFPEDTNSIPDNASVGVQNNTEANVTEDSKTNATENVEADAAQTAEPNALENVEADAAQTAEPNAPENI